MQTLEHHSNASVSIGLPVYNGENFLEEAIVSLLGQTYEDFELIISDNASTDKTEEICRTYAAQDKRLRYYRNEENLGAAKNFNRVFELSSGKYFKWAAHDDLCAPDFLTRCVEILDNNSSVVLCYSKIKVINADGSFRRYDKLNLNTASPKSHERFYDLVCTKHGCYQVWGLIRADILRQTPLIGSYAASDKILLAELSLYGQFYEIPEYLFWRRHHPNTSGNSANSRREWTVWFDPSKKGQILFPHWRIYIEILRSIRRGPLTPSERMQCYLPIMRQQGWLQGFGVRMSREALRGAYEFATKQFSSTR